ncbi:unnamed protein product [Chondrus crispus]|uniref:Uncharacterized protein n=1 Tax=Chondrus crispus TaxID=2769 RepID=R7QG56_CHOCR|nr:unnamed protein product [Chondrus crispus]CDF37482.1 unnamed protein product [Chondrus crispus]|eukprot:XP_005717353.1 unnamed protein product [Chondrus crispus]
MRYSIPLVSSGDPIHGRPSFSQITTAAFLLLYHSVLLCFLTGAGGPRSTADFTYKAPPPAPLAMSPSPQPANHRPDISHPYLRHLVFFFSFHTRIQ